MTVYPHASTTLNVSSQTAQHHQQSSINSLSLSLGTLPNNLSDIFCLFWLFHDCIRFRAHYYLSSKRFKVETKSTLEIEGRRTKSLNSDRKTCFYKTNFTSQCDPDSFSIALSHTCSLVLNEGTQKRERENKAANYKDGQRQNQDRNAQ